MPPRVARDGTRECHAERERLTASTSIDGQFEAVFAGAFGDVDLVGTEAESTDAHNPQASRGHGIDADHPVVVRHRAAPKARTQQHDARVRDRHSGRVAQLQEETALYEVEIEITRRAGGEFDDRRVGQVRGPTGDRDFEDGDIAADRHARSRREAAARLDAERAEWMAIALLPSAGRVEEELGARRHPVSQSHRAAQFH